MAKAGVLMTQGDVGGKVPLGTLDQQGPSGGVSWFLHLETRPMCQALLHDSRFFTLLLQIDHELAAQTQPRVAPTRARCIAPSTRASREGAHAKSSAPAPAAGQWWCGPPILPQPGAQLARGRTRRAGRRAQSLRRSGCGREAVHHERVGGATPALRDSRQTIQPSAVTPTSSSVHSR